MHLELHGGAPDKSLAALSSVGSVRQELAGLHDPDVDASLVHVSFEPLASTEDPYRTIGGGQTTSEGVRFRILRPHAKGGLGEVSVALDSELNREVALKEIQSKFADVSESRARFMLEAQITGGLEHPGIVPVYGMGTYADGRPFYAMRFIRGDSLKDGVRKFFARYAKTGAANSTEDTAKTARLPAAAYESLDFRQLLGRFVDVCNAVAYAHARGVLHRDLKPGNIMLGNYGETLVVDWGLAKATGHADDSYDTTQAPLTASTESVSAETRLGSALGTPGYMSPEQAAGRTDLFGPATDIYCLGATLYHLLTGLPPHRNNSDGNLLQRIQAGEFPRPREHSPAIPAPLASICVKAMATEQKDRYPTALFLAADIEHFLADDPVSAHRDSLLVQAQRWSRRHRTLVTAAAALLLTATLAITLSYFALSAEQSRTLVAKKKAEDAETKAKVSEAREREERTKATLALIESRKQLAANYFQHGLAEYSAGRFANAIRDLRRARATAPDSDPSLLRAYERVLNDRLFRGGKSLLPAFRHQGLVLFAEYSPDGRKVATASMDNTARIWDAETGAAVGEPLRHQAQVNAVSFSLDGRRVVTASSDKTARIWDAETGAAVGEPLLHEEPVNSALFSPDGRRVVTASKDKTARIWDAATGALAGEPLRHQQNVNSAVFSPDSLRVVTASNEFTARIWDAETGAAVDEPLRHELEVNSVAFSPDGRLLATASRDKSARIWDAATLAPVCEPLRHQAGVNTAVFSPDGLRVVTASDDFTARIWDAATGAALGAPLIHEEAVQAASFSPDGKKVVTAAWDRTARVWDAATCAAVGEPLRHESNLSAASFSPDGKKVVTASWDKTARIWEVVTGAEVSETLLEKRGVNWARFSPDGRRVVTASGDLVQVLDVPTGAAVGAPFRGKEFFNSAIFSPDGRRVLTTSSDLTARLWDAGTGAAVGEPMLHQVWVEAASFSPDGLRVATGSRDATARVWDAETGAAVCEPLRHAGSVVAVAFSPDGRRLVTSSLDHSARIWDSSTGAALGAPLRHAREVRAASFSPDGRRVVTASLDRTARLWDASTGAPVGEPLRHDLFVFSAEFSPDGRLIVTASEDRTARLWNAATCAPVGEPLRHDNHVYSAVFSPDGRRILTASRDQTARVWDAVTGASLGIPLLHTNGLHSAVFSPDGQFVMTLAVGGSMRIWECPELAIPEPVNLLFLDLDSGEELLAGGQFRALSPAELETRYAQVTQSSAWKVRFRELSPSRHMQQAQIAEAAQQWFAAAFHWKRLLLEKPGDGEIPQRVTECEAKWRKEVEAAERATKEKLQSKPRPPKPPAEE